MELFKIEDFTNVFSYEQQGGHAAKGIVLD